MKCVVLNPEFIVVETRRGAILGVLLLLGILARLLSINGFNFLVEDHHAETFCLAESFQYHLEEKRMRSNSYFRFSLHPY